eukprot:1679377-Rhodomonas_salina.1
MLLRMRYAMSGTDAVRAATKGGCVHRRLAHAAPLLDRSATRQTQIQETAFSVQILQGMRFLVFEFAVYSMSGPDHAPSCSAAYFKASRHCHSTAIQTRDALVRG